MVFLSNQNVALVFCETPMADRKKEPPQTQQQHPKTTENLTEYIINLNLTKKIRNIMSEYTQNLKEVAEYSLSKRVGRKSQRGYKLSQGLVS